MKTKEKPTKTKKHFIFTTDNFSLGIAKFTQTESGKRFLAMLTARTKRLDKETFSYRIINHWEKNGLLDNSRPEGKGWRKYSLMDRVWIQIIHELRKFGYSVKSIAAIKDNLVWTQGKGDLNYPLFEFYLSLAFCNKVPVFCLVFANSEIEFATEEQYNNTSQLLRLDNHIKLDFNAILQEIFPNKDLLPNTKYILSLNDQEMELMLMIRLQNYETITIKKKGTKIELLEATEHIHTEKRINEILKEGKYQDIEIKQANGKVVCIKRTTKKKLSD